MQPSLLTVALYKPRVACLGLEPLPKLLPWTWVLFLKDEPALTVTLPPPPSSHHPAVTAGQDLPCTDTAGSLASFPSLEGAVALPPSLPPPRGGRGCPENSREEVRLQAALARSSREALGLLERSLICC